MIRLSPFVVGCAIVTFLTVAGSPPTDAAGPFDGSYPGLTKLVRNSLRSGAGSGSCGGNAEGVPTTRRVVDSKIKITWAQSEIEFSVGADGTISGTSAAGASQITATGKISGGAMVMEHSSSGCGYRFEGRKAG